jgi:hypothetical protein
MCYLGGFTHKAHPKEAQTLTNSIAQMLQIGPKHFIQGLSPYFHLSYVATHVAVKWRQNCGPAHCNRDKVFPTWSLGPKCHKHTSAVGCHKQTSTTQFYTLNWDSFKLCIKPPLEFFLQCKLHITQR